MVLLSLPSVQRSLSDSAARHISALLGTEVRLDRASVGLGGSINLEKLSIQDRDSSSLLRVEKLSARLKLMPLIREGRIVVGSVLLTGPDLNLRTDSTGRLNLGYILDRLSNGGQDSESDLNLRINSLLIRKGHLTFEAYAPKDSPSYGPFSDHRLELSRLRANVSLKALSKDSINAALRQLSFTETATGTSLRNLTFNILGNTKSAVLSRLDIKLGSSSLKMDTLGMGFNTAESYQKALSDAAFRLVGLSGTLSTDDLAPFCPPLGKASGRALYFDITGSGRMDSIYLDRINLRERQEGFLLDADLFIKGLTAKEGKPVIEATLKNLEAKSAFLEDLANVLHLEGLAFDAALALDDVRARGSYKAAWPRSDLSATMETNLGSMLADVHMKAENDSARTLSAHLSTPGLMAGALLKTQDLGLSALSMDASARLINGSVKAFDVKGLVDSLEYKGHTYRDILVSADRSGALTKGDIRLRDDLISMDLEAALSDARHASSLDMTARISGFDPFGMGLSQEHENERLSLTLSSSLTGRNVDDFTGRVTLDSLTLTTEGKELFVDHVTMESKALDGGRRLILLESDHLSAQVRGAFIPTRLVSDGQVLLSRSLPSLIKEGARQGVRNKSAQGNDFSFSISADDTEMLSALSGVPLKIYAHSDLSGAFSAPKEQASISLYSPQLRYGDRFIESASLKLEALRDSVAGNAQMSERQDIGSMAYSVELTAAQDSASAVVSWGNDLAQTYSGSVTALMSLLRSPSEEQESAENVLEAVVDIQKSQVIVSDTLWTISPSRVTWKESRLTVEDFSFSSQGRHTRIDGIVSKRPTDTLWVDLSQMNIQYIFDVADQGVTFQGDGTGRCWIVGLLDEPRMSADLNVHNFGAFNGVVGDAVIHGDWINDIKGIDISAQITEDGTYTTHVDGYIYPLKPTSSLDLDIQAGGTNLDFLQGFLRGITPEFHGRVWGDVNLYGKFKALNLEGKVDANASMKIDFLGATYSMKDSVTVHPEGIFISGNRFYDQEGHESRMSGTVLWNHLRDIRYDFDFGMDHTLVFNNPPSLDFPFYGKVYGTGSTHLEGNDNAMNMGITVRTDRGSDFNFIKDGTSTATENQFITFNDLTPKRETPQQQISAFEAEQQKSKKEVKTKTESDFRLELLVDVTPDLNMRVIMDQASGDNISARGTANIRADYYNKGSFNMFGVYNLNSGVYKMSMQEVIRKDLQIQDGSTVSFNGDPMTASLDLHTTYQVNSASLNDLIPNASSYVDQTSVRVNCLIDIAGNLSSPSVTMGLELPLEREEVQSLVKNYIPTDDQMQMQILYLLGIGKFYTPDYVSVTQNSNVMSSVVSSTISGQLNNALSSLLNSSNWNFGTNLSTGQRGWTDMEFEGILSGALLNNRLLINGNLGYREDQMRGSTNFVGDFDAQLLLNSSGDIRLKAYNETNDRYYTRTNMTTQGVGVIFKKDFSSWNELMFWRKWLNQNRDKTEEVLEDQKDSAKEEQ